MAEVSYTVDLSPGDGRALAGSLLVLVVGAWVITRGSVSVLGVVTHFLRPALLGLAGIFLLILWSDVRNDEVDQLTVRVETDRDGATFSGSGSTGGDEDPAFSHDDRGSFTHDHPGHHTHGPDGWSEGQTTLHRHD